MSEEAGLSLLARSKKQRRYMMPIKGTMNASLSKQER